ncbi:MAG: hypothetical protein ACLT51_00805 [Faecalibacterium prausnitzii]|nr:MAG TPA: hypothetical protein [Caudoviricetes sp.]
MAGNQNTFRAGDKIKLDGVLFSNSQTHCGMRRRGEWFIYDGKLVNGRYRVTNLESRIGKYPISVNVSGYVEPSDIELVDNRNGR